MLWVLKVEYNFSQEDLKFFITILTPFLGVILTVLAILYTFETELRNNQIIKLLIKRKKYSEIYDRFTDSLMGIFYIFIIFILLYFLIPNIKEDFFIRVKYFELDFYPISNLIFNQLIFISLIFSLLRAYRCFYVFRLLQITMRTTDQDE